MREWIGVASGHVESASPSACATPVQAPVVVGAGTHTVLVARTVQTSIGAVCLKK